jgi:nucleoside phosphorylase
LLAFVAAEAREFAGLLRHCERVTRLNWPLDFARSAWLNGREVALAANGPGPRLAGRAAEVVKEHHELEGLVSIGFCGGLSPALKPCDIFVACSLIGSDVEVEAVGSDVVVNTGGSDGAGAAAGFDVVKAASFDLAGAAVVAHALSVPRSHSCERPPSKLLSIDRVATSSETKRTLHTQTHADAIEMEAAGLLAKASAWQIPLYAIKTVTDTSSETFPLDFNHLRDTEGRFSRSKIIAAAMRRPAAFPALLHLNRRCSLASEALGDFLAGTRF